MCTGDGLRIMVNLPDEADGRVMDGFHMLFGCWHQMVQGLPDRGMCPHALGLVFYIIDDANIVLDLQIMA